MVACGGIGGRQYHRGNALLESGWTGGDKHVTRTGQQLDGIVHRRSCRAGRTMDGDSKSNRVSLDAFALFTNRNLDTAQTLPFYHLNMEADCRMVSADINDNHLAPR